MEMQIERLQTKDIPLARKLTALVIRNNFQSEGLNVLKFRKELRQETIRVQKKFNLSHDAKDHFFVAKIDNQLVGVAGYGIKISKPIQIALKCSSSEVDMVELMSFYVNPNLQGQSIGSFLLKAIIQDLNLTDYQRISLYTGYQSGRNFWSRKLGDPSITLSKYFGEVDCWVWIKKISELTG